MDTNSELKDLAAKLRDKLACYEPSAPEYAPIARALYVVENAAMIGTEISELLDGIGPDVSPESIKDHYVARSRYLAEVLAGKRDPYPED